MTDVFGVLSQHAYDNLAGWLFLALIVVLAVWQIPHLIKSVKSIPEDKTAAPEIGAETKSATPGRIDTIVSASKHLSAGSAEQTPEAPSFVTVARFNTAVDAHILRGRLEDEGIPSNIVDAETVTMAWHLGQAVGGIKVQVFANDKERARDIIENSSVLQEIEPDEAEEGDVLRKTTRRALLASFLGLAFPPLQLYSFWLLGRLLSSHFGPIRGVRWRIILALILNLYFFVFVFFVFRMIATF
jgi:hypothetical protein